MQGCSEPNKILFTPLYRNTEERYYEIKYGTERKVVWWYDRSTKSWIVQTLDQDGNQIGDADYCGYKDWCASCIRERFKNLNTGEAA